MRKRAFLTILTILFIFSFFILSFSQHPATTNSTLRGDIDENGKIDIFDLLEMLKVLGNPAGKTDRQKQIVDVNASGAVDIFDLLGLLKVLSGKEQPGVIYWTTPGDTTVIQGITFVSIPGGTFQMGQTGEATPVHQITVSGFQMSRYEIIQAQYQAVIGSNPSYFTGELNQPVEQVTWYDAVRFCNTLSRAAGLDTCYNLSTWACDFTKNGYRLATEAEWEYACRAGTTTNYYTGDSESDLAKAGWYSSNSGSTTHAVGGKQANAFGLYDMHGNVWEWCNDWYGSYSNENATDPQGPPSGSSRVLRGGSWNVSASLCLSAGRYNSPANTRCNHVGFRVVRGALS